MGYRPRDRELAIELALELLATGRVRGIPPNHRPAELERLLGRPFDEGLLHFSGNLLRDWGLLEAYYEREHEGSPWHGTLLMGQLHRMPKPLKWKDIARELRRLGYEVTPEPQPTLEDDYFRVCESGAGAVVNGKDTGWPRGHIAKISSSDWLPVWSPSAPYDFNAVHRRIYVVTAEPERSWTAWLAAQQPESHSQWFRLAHRAVHTVAREHPEREPQAAALHDWLLSQAEAVNVLSDVEQALLTARCADGRFPFDALPARPGSPSPDAIIGRCLAVLPLTREAAQSLPISWRELTPADVQRSKLTRALLTAAHQVREKATTQELIDELAAWDDVLPTIC
ncbi:hypothetical protein AB0J14_34745 [Micromonospora arborensis]|uniref:hypothetical protein n=1 Tax=Micromonospora arborensis TaxID=2116518 RepID=UPI0033C40A7C